MSEGAENGIPRGALVVVAVGLIATLAAALLATDRSAGAATRLEWVQEGPIPDSEAIPVPGGGGEMRLTEAGLKATGTNFSGYALYRVAAVLRIDAGSPVGSSQIFCRVKGRNSFVAQTPELRASYPRSSERLHQQDEPEVVQVRFSSHGGSRAVVDFEDILREGFANEPGIKLEWPAYEEGAERWRWFLPPGPPEQDLVLPFATVFKTTGIPAAGIACTVTTSAGTATARTAGALPKISPPLDEEAEQQAQEEEESAEATEEAE